GWPGAAPGPGGPARASIGPWWRFLGGHEIRHGSRASSPYRATCPPGKVGNHQRVAQLAYAPGIWPIVGQSYRIGRVAGGSAVRLGVLQPVDQLGREGHRILLVREVAEAVEEPPAVGRLHV